MLAIMLSVSCMFSGANFAAGSDGEKQSEKPDQTVKQNKSEWSLVWSDEFNGDEIDRNKWNFDIGNWITDEEGNGITPGWGNNEKEYYTDSNENAFIEDGNLIIKAKKEQVTDKFGTYEYTSARMKTKDLFSKKYGRFEIKAKLPVGQGLWPAIWMLPEEDKYGAWAASGEIDIMEAWGSKPDRVAGTIHYGESWPSNKYSGKEYELPKNRGIDNWHTYALEWEPGEIRWYVDGELYQTQNDWYSKGKDNAANYSYPAPFDQEFHLLMNLAVGGWFDGDPDESTGFPAQMKIDYVRVYDLKKREYREPVEPIAGPVTLPADAKQPLDDGNLIYDQNFEQAVTEVDQAGEELDPMYWNFVHLPDFGGNGSFSIENIESRNFLKTEVTEPGSQLYSLQLIQQLSLGKGGKYKVSFDAKSSTDRNMMAKVGAGASRGWTKYSNEETFNLTDELKSYEFTFDMVNETDIAARLELNLGGNGTAPVWIGNVRVEDISGLPVDYDAPKQPLPDGNHIYNGTFDQGEMDRMTFWNFILVADAKATASVNEESRELSVKIGEPGDAPEAVQLNQKGIPLIKGNDYQLTFDARADIPRTIQVGILNKDGSLAYSGMKSVALSPEMETHTVSFTMGDNNSDYEGQVVFNMGEATGDLYLDNVSMIKTTSMPDYGNIDLAPLKNGDFSNDLSSWTNYVHFDASAQFGTEEEEAKISIANEGNEPWSVILEQGDLKLAEGAVYELSFEARSTKERDAEITVENAQYTRFFSKVVSLSEQEQRFTYEFVMPSEDTAAFKLLLGKTSQSPVGNHDVYIDNVSLKVKSN
ncbi:carbohydrate binding domain-containing protein [Pseudalkalibacillus caeni]|nr:carbohydrate binding domain-containing protein [Pseudalkalibacillus caeni]